MRNQLLGVNLSAMIPEIFLFIWGLVVMTIDLATKRRSGKLVTYMAMLGLFLTGIALCFFHDPVGDVPMFINDPLALFFKVIFIAAAFMAIGSSFGVIENRITNHRGEYFGLIIFSTVGMMFLASANELIALYIGLELTTIPLFVLAAFFKEDRLSVEAGMKYLVVGALSSAFLLYGLSFLYGLSGTTSILHSAADNVKMNIASLHIKNEGIGFVPIIAVVTILAGIGFKLALPPFHQWAPDVYEGAPTPIAAFLSVGSKAAGLVAFAKIMINSLEPFYDPSMSPNDWGRLVGIMAVAAMIIGNVVAIRQHNIKRMLAYSSIAQAGYIMVGMLAFNALGLSSVAFFIFTYLFANMGLFAVVTIFEDRTGSCQIASYSGLAKSSPFLAAAASVFLLSLAGIPPLAGFLAKYYVFAAAIQMAGVSPDFHWLYWVVGVALLTSVFALYYYAYVIKTMYFNKAESPYHFGLKSPVTVMVIIALAGVIIFGLVPEPVIRYATSLPAAWGFLGQ